MWMATPRPLDVEKDATRADAAESEPEVVMGVRAVPEIRTSFTPVIVPEKVPVVPVKFPPEKVGAVTVPLKAPVVALRALEKTPVEPWTDPLKVPVVPFRAPEKVPVVPLTAPENVPPSVLMLERAVSMSVMILVVMVRATWSPMTMGRAPEPSWVRTMVSVLPDRAVTRRISAFALVGCVAVGHTVMLKGATDGNCVPSTTNMVVPLCGGIGAELTEEIAKFLWASNVAMNHSR
jgi:hypothetical protein